MQYRTVRPHQIREAIDKNYPVVLPSGVIECHAGNFEQPKYLQ